MSLLNNLIISTIETGAITAVLALIQLVLYKVYPSNYMHVTVEFVLGRLSMVRSDHDVWTIITRELMETERKYVQDLELMQKYAVAVSDSGLLPRHTIHLLFSNLTELLAFQRKFLLRLEATEKLPWQEQRWGQHFVEAEEDFGVYEPYCVNWSGNSLADLPTTNRNPPVSNRILHLQKSMTAFNHLMDFRTEFPAFVVKPVSRVCKYPLLIESLRKISSPDTYQHYDELTTGLAAMKRVVERVNNAERIIDNLQIVVDLRRCVVDWKGHEVDTFGSLLLDETSVVSRAGVERKFLVFLFENIILFCVNAPGVPPPYNRPRRQTTPLLLKGRVLVTDVKQIESVEANQALLLQRYCPLDVWWEGEHGLEVLTLCFSYKGERSRWEAQLRQLIRECAERRAHEHSLRRKSRQNCTGRDGGGTFNFDEDPVEESPLG
ncbi:Dbl homology domain-containing protein [Mycena olivaceomarginata]|nr:Dbl homology domain-containing protein [Mycena olivaceomarginata]